MRKAIFTMMATLAVAGLSAEEAEETKIVEPVELNEVKRSGITNPLIYDRYMTPHAVSADLVTIHRALQKAEDAITGDNPSDSVGSGIGRFFELGLIWTPINFVTTASQYGLGVRSYAKENHIHTKDLIDQSYKHFRTSREASFPVFNKSLSTENKLGASTALFAAGDVMQNKLALDWVEKKGIDARESSLYIWPSQIKRFWIKRAKKETLYHTFHYSNGEVTEKFEMHEDDFNPASDYINGIEETFGIKVSRHRLRDASYLSYADPMFWFAQYSNLYYIVTGKEMELPMIPTGDGGWLPAFGLELTPSGPEYLAKVYTRSGEGNPMMFYGKYGRLAGERHWGAGIEAPKVFAWGNNSAGFKLDVFEQLHADEDKNISKRKGGAISLINSTEIGETGVGVFTQLGYKSAGYIAGESEKKGLIARGGFSFIF